MNQCSDFLLLSNSLLIQSSRTIRGAAGADFARQVAERDAAAQPAKKFRSSAPKGSKLAAGYHDRTKERVTEEEDDRAKRVKALEDTMKLGQIDRETFEKLRDEIVGGDVSSTHLIKGLDWKLLQRVKRGEDVSRAGFGSASEENASKSPPADIDDELDKLEEQEVTPVAKENVVKRGQMAPPPPVVGAKRNRDAILAELKASRQAAAQAKQTSHTSLGPKFRKIGDRSIQPRIERDRKGREVLITVDENGNVKRKVRKTKAEDLESSDVAKSLHAPIVNTTPLGMEVPELPQKPVEEEDDDIFQGVGTNYDPLAGLEEDDYEDSEAQENSLPADTVNPSPAVYIKQADTQESNPKSAETAPPADGLTQSRNYFADPAAKIEQEKSLNPMDDPTILAALKKAQKIKTVSEELNDDDTDHDGRSPKDEDDEEREARLRRRAAMLAVADRDLDDMDMGFGSSRFGDAEEAEGGGKVKLSEWKGMGEKDDEEGKDEGRGGKKRKRGPKKRKGNKDSAADVMKVIESRKK